MHAFLMSFQIVLSTKSNLPVAVGFLTLKRSRVPKHMLSEGPCVSQGSVAQEWSHRTFDRIDSLILNYYTRDNYISLAKWSGFRQAHHRAFQKHKQRPVAGLQLGRFRSLEIAPLDIFASRSHRPLDLDTLGCGRCAPYFGPIWWQCFLNHTPNHVGFFRWYYSLNPIERLDTVVKRRSADGLGHTAPGILEASTVGSTLPQCAAKSTDLIQYKTGEAGCYPDHSASWTVVAHLVETDQWFLVFLDNWVSLPVSPEEVAVNGLIQFQEKELYWTYSTCPEQDRRVSAAVAYFLVRDHEIQESFSQLEMIYRNAAVITTLAQVHRRRPQLTFSW